jgi:hypothetical protein
MIEFHVPNEGRNLGFALLRPLAWPLHHALNRLRTCQINLSSHVEDEHASMYHPQDTSTSTQRRLVDIRSQGQFSKLTIDFSQNAHQAVL